MTPQRIEAEERGGQRLSLERLKAWQTLGYGMFIHFGLSTFEGVELSSGKKPSSTYAPDRLDVDQWICVARDAGMSYAVLTAKHVSGHSLWPTKSNDYHVGTSGNKTDVVGAFVDACQKRGVRAGFYYCSWDNHNRFGSHTPGDVSLERAYTTQEYREFQEQQIEELATQYGQIEEFWIDCPTLLGADGRRLQYEQIARLQPQAVIVMNAAFTGGDPAKIFGVWPTDVFTIERGFPKSENGERKTGYNPWIVGGDSEMAELYYIPGESCDTIGRDWFYVEEDVPRSDEELLGMYLVTRSRGANLLLNVGPDRHGLISEVQKSALTRLRRNINRLGC